MLQNETDSIAHAGALLRAGKLVSFPTETVYGLGANALSDAAVAAIYAAKGRPTFNPLIVHVASVEEAKKYVVWNDRAELLAQTFWPGPLTFVLPRQRGCTLSLLVSAGMDTVAIRMPAHPLALALLKETQLPLAAPSANISGRISPTLASHVVEEFGGNIMVLDGGPCAVGIESTIIDLTTDNAIILRHGTVISEALQKIIPLSQQSRGDAILAPGMMKSHYAPNAKVRLNATDVREGEALLAFGTPLAGAGQMLNLSPSANLEEAAANLFKMLRELDAANPKTIAVMPISMKGLGVAINDRLSRAAADKV